MIINTKPIKDACFLITLALISVWLAIDISANSISSHDLMKHFNINQNQFDNLIKLRITGVAFGSFFASMLLNKFHKKSILTYSLIAYIIFLSMCEYFLDFRIVATLNFLASFSKGIPSTLILLFLVEHFPHEEAAKKNVIISLILTILGIAIPALILVFADRYGWKTAYLLPVSTAMLLLVFSTFFIDEETRIQNNGMNFLQTIKSFGTLIKNIDFLLMVSILLLPGLLVTAFQFNSPLIIKKFGNNISTYTIFNISQNLTVLIASYLSLHILKKSNLNFLCFLGIIILCISIILMFRASLSENSIALLIACTLSSIAISFMKGYNIKIYSTIPHELKGVASSFLLIITVLASDHEIMFAQKLLNMKLSTNLSSSFLPSTIFLISHLCVILILLIIREYINYSKNNIATSIFRD